MDDMNLENEKIFYCLVDTAWAVKDYLQGGRCVRLIAVRQREFSSDSLNSGVTTFTIDVDFWLFCGAISGIEQWQMIHRDVRGRIEGLDSDPEVNSTWFCLELEYRPKERNYLYRTFSNDRPHYFKIVSLRAVTAGPVLSPPSMLNFTLARARKLAAPWPFTPNPSGKPFVFDTFHVGQGMCSLVHDGSNGILLDLGAGKPVTRPEYQSGTLHNDLRIAIAPLKHLVLVISHADSDHWRIMGWDPALLNDIDEIYAPNGAISLAMTDKAVKKKIHGLEDTTWHLNSTTTLHLWKSDPSHHDENGNCLVAVFNRAGRRVLAPGDYVYKRFKSDTNTGINTLHAADYAAVVVPHHGDEASATHLVTAANGAKAFFSAGTHKKWGHPTQLSLDEHASASFNNISHPTQADIIKVNLI